MKLKTSLVALSALTLGISSASAVSFSLPDFVWFHPSGGGTPNHIWIAGDYWGQQFNATGISAVDHMDLTLDYDDNGLFPQSLDVSVLLNGSTVGGFLINPGDIGPHTYPLDFPAVAGPDYLLQVVADNTIDPGNGAVSITVSDGQSFAALTEAVPEASTWMAGAAIASLAGWRLWRRRQN